MGTLASELGPHAERLAARPRVYVDANVPVGLVDFMRERLGWDTLYVVDYDDLRRAPDGAHFRLARQLRRTLITFDRDYLDARRFPTRESAGVLVLTAPDVRGYTALLTRIDTDGFHAAGGFTAMPYEGRTLHLHVDWTGESPAPLP
jgi:predicted nuclease of predicted toxin-antitoxin system